MSGGSTSCYRQPEKETVRQLTLSEAVRLLTEKAEESVVVQREEVAFIAQQVVRQPSLLHLRRDVEFELEKWLEFHRSRVRRKNPGELRVLYLCGPEPLNDLKLFLNLGIKPENIWGIESKEGPFRQALRKLERSGSIIKLHLGNVADFLEVCQEQFDIIYYDVCGPFLGRRPDTLAPLIALLKSCRLTSLSVLITNFAQVTPEYRDRLARIMTSYFQFRPRTVPDVASDLDPETFLDKPERLHTRILQKPDDFYSDFITRFIADLARFWIPNCRALASKSVMTLLLREKKSERQRLLEEAQEIKPFLPDLHTLEEWLLSQSPMVLAPSAYPLFSFYLRLTEEARPDPLLNQLANLTFQGQRGRDLIGHAAMLDSILEGHWDCLSPRMRRAVGTLWFDSKARFSCDTPTPSLLVNTLLGIYGYPYFPSASRCRRYKYKAKATTMLTDLFLLDQCRYFFDWFPVLDLVPVRFNSKGFQIVARCIMDRIGRSDWNSESHPFRASVVLPLGPNIIEQAREFPSRALIRARV